MAEANSLIIQCQYFHKYLQLIHASIHSLHCGQVTIAGCTTNTHVLNIICFSTLYTSFDKTQTIFLNIHVNRRTWFVFFIFQLKENSTLFKAESSWVTYCIHKHLAEALTLHLRPYLYLKPSLYSPSRILRQKNVKVAKKIAAKITIIWGNFTTPALL